MEFRILGPLEALDDGRSLEIGGRKQRALLAVLLLRANEVVSVDTLVDELWAEEPPPTAAKTLQAHISRLRSALPNVALETRGHGYMLRIEPRQLDADAYTAMLEDARRRLADGELEAAAELLRQALALWRGAALADFTYEPFAQPAIARLEELRLAGIEERIEADLRLGRHAALVPELDALAAENPLRERVVAQRLLALYRSDRQAEALAAYERARQRFAEELGLEPSESLQRLHVQILEHDPALAVPGRPRFVPLPLWRHPRRLVGAGVLVLSAAAIAIALGVTGGGSATRVAGALALDPSTGHVEEAVPLGTSPSSVAVGSKSVWVLDADDRTISEVDATRHKVKRTFSIASVPADLAVGTGAVWIANTGDLSKGETLPQSISRLDPATGEVEATIQLPRSRFGHWYGVLPGLSRRRIAVTHDAVWAINPNGSVSRIDIRTNRLVKTLRNVEAENIAAGEGQVWVTEDTAIAQIDPDLNVVSRRIDVAENTLGELAIGGGAVWAADPFGGKVWRVESTPTVVKRAIPVKRWVASVAFADGVVWAANEITDEVYRIDTRSNTAAVGSRVFAPRTVAAGQGGVWVSAPRPPSHDSALPQPTCGPVFYGGSGKPDLLIVSDLPLKGDNRDVKLGMVKGVRLVLRQRGFDAGGYSVGYQSCDSATAQGGTSDFFRCALNAKAFAGNLSVVAVFGSYFSYCSFLQIPITNRAPEGSLAMISPSNTDESLTRDPTLYPTGARNYVRIAGADHLQAAAHAEFVSRLGRRALFVLSPGEDDYFRAFGANVQKAAARLGLSLVGSATYDFDARDFTALARRVARAGPDAVVVTGILAPGTGTLIRDLRAALGHEVAIVVPDGFNVPDGLRKLAGPGAQGLYVSNYGTPNSHLPPRGKRFLAEFTRTHGVAGPDLAAVYGAQAGEILLDAIARSDGTRDSVTAELRRTRIENGMLGDISFDRRGDLVEAPFTFFRVVKGRFVVDRVITARSALLRG